MVTSVFSRAKHQRHVFPRLAPVTSFPAFGADYMFRLNVFPRFSAFGAVCKFSRAWYVLRVMSSNSDSFNVLFAFVMTG